MKKKLVLGLTSLVVASAVAIGGTLAFMTKQTNTMTNTFKAADGLTGEIRENKWDGYDFGETNSGKQPDGLSTKGSSTDAGLGYNQAQAMTPGQTIDKNPTLGNTSKVPVFMAMKVTYDSKAKFTNIASFSKDAGWVKATAAQLTAAGFTDTESEIYFYGSNTALTEVPAATIVGGSVVPSKTSALFNSVVIKSAIDTQTLTDNAFSIIVMGSAVQTTNIDDATARTQLINTLK